MERVCPKCGTMIPEGVSGCPACGDGALKRIVLTGAAGVFSSGIDIEFGQALARKTSGDESRFLECRQFDLKRVGDGWSIAPVAGVRNETFLNGASLAAESPLNEGDEISVKGKAAFMKVSFE